MYKIGIPRTLFFYTFFPMWKKFFEEIGLEIITSPQTNKEILDLGVQETVNDACVPIKLYHGHIMALKDQVDFLFIPRLISADRVSTFCPKFLGLPDMVRFSRDDLPPIIDTRFSMKKLRPSLYQFFNSIGHQFSINKLQILKAYLEAKKVHKKYFHLMSRGIFPNEAQSKINTPFSEISFPEGKMGKLNLAVLGYPYTINDPYISGNLISNLKKMDINFFTPENVTTKDLKQHSRSLPLNFFWYYSNRTAWSALYFLEKTKEKIDGIIHVTAFGCGPDAMLNKLMELEAKKRSIPFLSISVDEHSGEAGILTRLEAFTDMLMQRKREKGGVSV